MKVVFNCVVCSSAHITKYLGQFAPFLAHRLFDYPLVHVNFGDRLYPPMLLTNSIRCEACGFIFSQLRPDPDEMARLYKGYRGEEYMALRKSFEPESRHVIAFSGNHPVEIASRQAAAEGFLGDAVDLAAIRRVLDYGGDQGQHIPAMFDGCERYVYEISGVDAVPGVKLVHTLRGLGNMDFVIAANVLEHVSYPLDLMRELRSVCGRDTLLFIDVPLETHDGT